MAGYYIHTSLTFFYLLFTTLMMLNNYSISVQAQTRVGYYSRTCPRAETIIRSTVSTHFRSNPTIAAGLLRMHFHDCFVQGCDASILIDGTSTEKTARPNLLLRGYEVIDDAKTQLEAACPNVVSCADILAIAARDSVVVSGGASWSVPTGRLDGRVSIASETDNLPGFTDSIEVQIQKFVDKKLNTQDLVTLVGGHTIGTSACQFFRYRLYNFNETGTADPTINPSFLTTLRNLCPDNGDASRRVALDTGSENRFDQSYYTNLRNGRGVLESDQKLWNDASTRTFVQRFSGPFRGLSGLIFNVEFGRSMVKMSNIEVKTGTQGEIRRICSAIN
ncbi:hypothetical protein MKW98_001256 [Papaver atlanticum]|uniref:Peroxidase n=1 Tax=Papaver atlanticum TaxID=357466 RepID=A0AAD4SRP5_9MAGN|nr:hypothetical protein MKW98_001256 [Papaver atlanticum]